MPRGISEIVYQGAAPYCKDDRGQFNENQGENDGNLARHAVEDYRLKESI